MLTRLSTSLLALFLLSLSTISAQETKTESLTEEGGKEEKKEPPIYAELPEPENRAEAFEALTKERDEFQAKLKKIADEYRLAKSKTLKDNLEKQFNSSVEEFKKDLLPRLLSAAAPVYLKDDRSPVAKGIVLGWLQDLFGTNQYWELVRQGRPYLKAGNKDPILLNLMGVSLFAEHDFEEAEKVLKQAEEEGGQVFEGLGQRYFEEVTSYKKLWAAEQKIRETEDKAEGDKALPIVEIETSKGKIEIVLFENEAPNTVANFISLVEKKYYDNILFHRVIPGFMAQGGDPNTLDDDPSNDGGGGPGYNIKCECYEKNARKHFAGSLSMAHAGKDTGGSQFFITHLPTAHLNPNLIAEKGHTVFGRVTKGLDIARSIQPRDKIVSAKVVRKRDHEYKPETIAE